VKFEHPTKPGKVTVAGKPGADVPRGRQHRRPWDEESGQKRYSSAR